MVIKRKNILSAIVSFIIAASICGCGAKNGSDGAGDPCTGRVNPQYHKSYFEMCGNAEQPITNGREQTVSVWVEVDSPFSSSGKVWVDDIYLERSDKPGVNLVPNASFDRDLSSWLHHENAMCLAEDTWCQNVKEYTQDGVWSLDNKVFHSGPASAVADMSVLGQGYQTHIFQFPLITISGIKPGVEFKAHAYVKVEGDVQARLGLGFREADVNQTNPMLGIRAVNGKVIQGATDWTLLDMR